MKIIIETERLILREFTTNDAAFIYELVNTPIWLQFIGQRNVHSLTDAKLYLKNGSIKSYSENGFGFYAVLQKDTNTLVGMCGLIKRETLENIDIGFAFLPSFIGKGFGFEAATATLTYAHTALNINKIIAIVDPENTVSIALIKKLGMVYENRVRLSSDDIELMLFCSKAH